MQDTIKEQSKLQTKVEKYFSSGKFLLISPILMGEDTISMSLIYYTVTKYASEFQPYIMIDDKPIYIHRSYRAKLHRYTKDFFDAFCREVKYPFFYEPGKSIITTIGQLNFYKWCVEINLINYIRENYDEIKYHMDLTKDKSSEKRISSSTIDESMLTTSERNKIKNKVVIRKTIQPSFI